MSGRIRESDTLMHEPGWVGRVLEPGGIDVVFQPVVEVHGDDWRLHGVEALSRVVGSGIDSTEALFHLVRRERLEPIVDRACISEILLEARGLSPTTRLSINVHAMTLATDSDFPPFVQDTARMRGITVEQLTLEIVRHFDSFSRASFLVAVDRLHAAGIQIALDDIGMEESSLRWIQECRPDYFKIDGGLLRGASDNARQQAVLECVAGHGSRLAARGIAKRVEDVRELRVLAEAGIDLAQGFLFCAPLPRGELRARGLLDDDAGSSNIRARLDGPPLT